MWNTLRLYRRFLALSALAQLQYRVSFVMQVLGQLGVSGIEFFSLWALFRRFHRLGTWTLPEVGVFYGVVGLAWALADTVGRGFDNFGLLVRAGDFDRILLRPRSTVFQLLAQDTQFRRLGRMVQALAVLGWSWTALDLNASAGNFLLVLLAVASGAALFLGLLIIQATIAFWTIESLEIMNVLTYGGAATAQYPMSIYPGWLRKIFYFGVPLGCVTYLPVCTLLGRADQVGLPLWLGWIAPLVGFGFFALALLAWRIGTRHYASTGC